MHEPAAQVLNKPNLFIDCIKAPGAHGVHSHLEPSNFLQFFKFGQKNLDYFLNFQFHYSIGIHRFYKNLTIFRIIENIFLEVKYMVVWRPEAIHTTLSDVDHSSENVGSSAFFLAELEAFRCYLNRAEHLLNFAIKCSFFACFRY